MKKLSMMLAAFTVGVALFGIAVSAQASKIEYTLSGTTLDFTVFNDTLTVPVSSFDIRFGVTSDGLNFTNTDAFANISDGTAPAGWASLALGSGALSDPWMYTGFVDTSLSVPGAPIGVGGSLGGFSTVFTLAGPASLDGLWFNFYDDQFNTLDSGTTVLQQEINPPDAVPEPGTIMLLGAGMGGLLLYRRKRA